MGSLHDYPVPEGEQEIVRVTEMRGSNIVEVVRPSGEKILCLMPAKFKKTLWIKRGNYLIIEPFEEVLNKADKKLRGRIATVLFPNHVKNIERLGLWPTEWKSDAANVDAKTSRGEEVEEDDDEVDDEDEDPYLVNPNHRHVADSDDDDDDDEEEDSDDEDDDDDEEDSD